MVKYIFKSDEPLTIKSADKASAQKIGEALADITAKNGGRLTPRDVLVAAQDRRHILHRHFEWDDAKAAERYRLDQARSLVRSIHVESDETESGVARAYLSIRDGGATAYRSIAEVLTSADLQQRVLAAAERDLISFETRYRALEDICAVIRSARERIAQRRSRQAGQDNRASA